MKRKVWVPLVLALACAAAVTGYAYTNARHAVLDAPRASTSQATADAWLEQDVSVPAGTEVSAVLQSNLTTKSARVGDEFTARVEAPVAVNGSVAIPAGALVHGHVVVAEPGTGASGSGRLQLAFDAVSFGGRIYSLDAQGPVYVSGPGARQGAGLAAGANDVGGVQDGVVGGTAGGAAKGALVGGATGTAASLWTRGPEIKLPAGRTVRFTLDRDVDVTPARGTA